MDYQQALDYIYSFINLEARPASKQTRQDYNLDQIRALLAALGNPQDRYPTVHITGTKGKGSTAAMLTSILTAAGYRTGLYTSPHLHTYRERICVDSRLITEDEVIDWLVCHRELLESIEELTTFEITTAMGYDFFAKAAVDIAVIEVGLGGRLDTTNVITPVLSIITSISLEHTAILGDTIPQIASEKAGIIKPGVSVITVPQEPAAASVIRQTASELGAPLTTVGTDWTYTLVDMAPGGQSVEIQSPAGTGLHVRTPLIGAHEALNTTVAVAAAYALKEQTYTIDETHIVRGLNRVAWPGRVEIINECPWIIVDGAHNGASAQALFDTVNQLFGPRSFVLVFGIFTDKRIDDMLEVLLPAADKVIVTRSDHPRAADPAALQQTIRQHGRDAIIVPRVEDALLAAVRTAGDDDLIIVTGSLSLAGKARMAWMEHVGRPLPPHDPPLVL